MDTFGKLFALLLLCRRLERWFRPDREQAGAQKGRGRTEHILRLSLLIDYAKSTLVGLVCILHILTVPRGMITQLTTDVL